MYTLAASGTAEDFITQIFKTIDSVQFSARELDILACLIPCKSSKKIAEVLEISSRTVDTYLYQITHKLGVRTRGDLINLMEKQGDLQTLNAQYAKLLRIHQFKEAMKKTAGHIREKHLICRIICTDLTLLEKIALNLKKVGIKVLGNSDDPEVKTIHVVFPGEEEQNPPISSVFYTGNEELLFFEIVDHLYPSVWAKEALHYFRDNINSEGAAADRPHRKMTLPYRISILYVILFVLFFGGCGFLYLKAVGRTATSTSMFIPMSLQKHLHVPYEKVALNRPQIIKKMEAAFAAQKSNIKIIALTGIGGAGKTTLARQYARQKKATLTWEFNAETEETLIESFVELAAILAHTPADKRAITSARQKIGHKENRRGIVNYVHNYLKNKSGWLLIFDNVTLGIDLKFYLPPDTENSGKGEIILTTRNLHIRNFQRVHSIAVDMLSPEEGKLLFSKIMETTPDNLEFLSELPPFPLDISSAAYYIKDTKIPHKDYLKHLRKYDKNFQTMQKEINCSVGDYVLTRQHIIDATARKIIAEQEDFADLLLCIALLDSQNIPQEFLSKYKTQTIVDLFIHTLKNIH